jgi:hypothetical protein
VKDDGTSITTINAKWDGTQWVKDVSANPSIKQLLDGDSLKIFKKTTNVGGFLDTAWTNKDEVKHYLVDDDFMKGHPTVALDGTSGTYISSYFYTLSASNIQTKMNPTPSSDTYGEIIFRAKSVGAFSASYYTGFLNTGSNTDFEMQFKVLCADNSVLPTASLNDTGLVLGIYDIIANNYTVALKASSDKANWYLQIQATLIDTVVPVTASTTVIFKRAAGILYTYINGVLVDSRAFSVALQAAPLEITLTGTSTAPNLELLYVDFFRFWSATLSR